MTKRVRWSDKAMSDRQGFFEANVENESMAFAKKDDKNHEGGLIQ